MRLVIDTNVFIPGVFFSGPPYDILDAWRRGRIKMIVSPEILEEYRRVGEELATEFPGVDLEAFLELVTLRARIVDASPLKEKVCSDQDDEKFLACAQHRWNGEGVGARQGPRARGRIYNGSRHGRTRAPQPPR